MSQLAANRLSAEFRSDLRYFAFFVGNKSVLAAHKRYELDYFPFLVRKNSVFGQLFSIFVNHWQPWSNKVTSTEAPHPHVTPKFRAGQYLLHRVDSDNEVVPPFEAWELEMAESEFGWKTCIKEFSTLLGDGKLEPAVLADIDYVPDLFGMGSTLEAIYAVLGNVLLIDEEGNPTNREQAFFRAAQCVREWCVQSYEAEPPFAPWETELH